MGIGNLFKNAKEKTTDLVKNEIERQAEVKRLNAERKAEMNALLAEQRNMPRVMLQIESGFQQVHTLKTSAMYQRKDGTVYFGVNYNDRFIIIDYIWNGPMYETSVSSVANSTGQEVTNGKSGKMAAGAIVGTVLAPGVGTVVGAAVGAGGKKKKKKVTQTQTNTVQRQTEILTPATLKFRNLDTDDIVSIVIGCNSLIDSQIQGLQIFKEQPARDISRDTTEALSGIKALKELLDMGAITQEEFDEKKKQMLNI